MAYDEDLADRIRTVIGDESVTGQITEKRMFGGLAFLLDGNMAVAASSQGGLLLRVEPDDTEALLMEPYVGPMQMRGREMTGWLRVDAEGAASEEHLRRWVNLGLTRAGALPAK